LGSRRCSGVPGVKDWNFKWATGLASDEMDRVSLTRCADCHDAHATVQAVPQRVQLGAPLQPNKPSKKILIDKGAEPDLTTSHAAGTPEFSVNSNCNDLGFIAFLGNFALMFHLSVTICTFVLIQGVFIS